MIKVKISDGKNTIKGNHPEKWEELTPKQFIAIAKYFNGDIADLSRRIELFFALLDVKPKNIGDMQADEALILKIIELGSFMNKPAPDQWFIPFVSPKFKNQHSPRPSLSGSTFKEFIYADTFFQYWNESKSGEYAWKLASIIYRPKGRKGDDIRIPFDDSFNTERFELFKKVNGYVLEAIVFNYAIVRKYITDMYPRLFPKSDNSTDEDDSTITPDEPVWVTLLDAICQGDGVKIKQYEDLEVHEVLRLMEKTLKDKH